MAPGSSPDPDPYPPRGGGIVKVPNRSSTRQRIQSRLIYWLISLLAALPAEAQTTAPGEFYEGKTITIVTSTGSGGSYDVTARLVSRHMPRHIPGSPAMIVQNMPGAGNVLATNYMYSIAPRDGTTIATLHNAIPLHQTLSGAGVRYDAGKFNWLGSTGPENEVIIAWHTAGVRTIEDARQKEVVLGGTGAGSGIVIIPRAMNNLLGTRFKLVMGYRSSEDVNLAMQRGEVQARAFSFSSILMQRADWLKENKITVLAQAGAKRAHELPDVPLLTELANDETQHRILKLISSPPGLGRPYAAPPGMPPDRLALLRKAFAASLSDAAFLAEAEKLGIDIEPMSADEVTRIVEETVNAPADVVAGATAAIGSSDR